jgi:REP element-mobilizing transposase RayT
MCGIARTQGFGILGINGVEEHVHVLLALNSTTSIAMAVQLLKGTSSKWIHDTFPECHDFGWREGYSAFSVGVSMKNPILRYIARQQEHHATETFDQEYDAMLKKHSIAHN